MSRICSTAVATQYAIEVVAAARDATGRPAASVGLTFRLADADDERCSRLGVLCADAAAELTRRLGGG